MLVETLTRRYQDLTARHWKAVIKIMSYLRATKGLGVTYLLGSGLDVHVYTDATQLR